MHRTVGKTRTKTRSVVAAVRGAKYMQMGGGHQKCKCMGDAMFDNSGGMQCYVKLHKCELEMIVVTEWRKLTG